MKNKASLPTPEVLTLTLKIPLQRVHKPQKGQEGWKGPNEKTNPVLVDTMYLPEMVKSSGINLKQAVSFTFLQALPINLREKISHVEVA